MLARSVVRDMQDVRREGILSTRLSKNYDLILDHFCKAPAIMQSSTGQKAFGSLPPTHANESLA
jgi:hypothetical protein